MMFRSYVRFAPIHLAHAARSLAITQIAQAYQLPKITSKRTGVIGIISLGGGVVPGDTEKLFSTLGLPIPVINYKSIGAVNSPGQDADVENNLDVQISAAIYSYMTGQPANINFYSAPNSDSGFVNGFKAMQSDNLDAYSCSWGSAESNYGKAVNTDPYNNVFKTFNGPLFAASGDNGSRDQTSKPTPDFPASSPYVIGVGGTMLQLNSDGSIMSETVWNDGNLGGSTGGGPSNFFARPSYQNGLWNGNSRGVPDLAANASPMTGWQIVVNGRMQSIGGTSAAAPFWAGVAAALASTSAGPITNFLNRMYSLAPNCFRDIVVGNNGDFNAGPMYDVCTGRGCFAPEFASIIGSNPIPPIPPIPVPPGPTPVSGFPNYIGTVSGTIHSIGAVNLKANLSPNNSSPSLDWGTLLGILSKISPIIIADIASGKNIQDIITDVIAALASNGQNAINYNLTDAEWNEKITELVYAMQAPVTIPS